MLLGVKLGSTTAKLGFQYMKWQKHLAINLWQIVHEYNMEHIPAVNSRQNWGLVVNFTPD